MLTDYMSQAKKEEENLVLMHWYNDLKTTQKARRKTDFSYQKQETTKESTEQK